MSSSKDGPILITNLEVTKLKTIERFFDNTVE